MAHRSIEALAKLAEHHGVPLTFNREIEPMVTPIEATLIDIVTRMSEVDQGEAVRPPAARSPAAR